MEETKKMHLASGEVVTDRENSHVKDHSSVIPFLEEALLKIHANGRGFIIEEVHMGRIIGKNICVITGPDDQIVFEKRPNRAGLTRFVKNRTPEPCDSVTILLKAVDGGYEIITAFIGPMAPPEPWDERGFQRAKDPEKARQESIGFWSNHALVWGIE